MAKVSTGDFLGKFSGSGGNWSDWRENGKIIGWIHPAIYIHERSIHGRIPSNEKDRDGNKKWRNRRFNCTGKKCVLCELSKFAKWAIEKGIDPKEVIIDGNKLEYTLNDLAGNGGWRQDIRAKEEYIIPFIAKDDRDDKNPVELITATRGLGFAIKKVIESQIEDRGEKKGNPAITPYAFKFKYDKDANNPSHKYSAERVDSDLAEIDDDVKAIMTATEEDLGFSMATFTDPSPEDKVLEALESCWDSRQVPFEEFLEYSGFELGKSKAKDTDDDDKAEKKSKAKAKAKDEDDDEDEEKGGKQVVFCDDCKIKVKPNKFGRCPECGEKLDVPF